MFLRKVGEKLTFFCKTWVFIEKNLDYLACFSFFWPKKWWISEKEFKIRNVEKDISVQGVAGSVQWINLIGFVVCYKSNGTRFGGELGIRNNNGYLAEFFFILFKFFFTVSDKYCFRDIDIAGLGEEIAKEKSLL